MSLLGYEGHAELIRPFLREKLAESQTRRRQDKKCLVMKSERPILSPSVNRDLDGKSPWRYPWGYWGGRGVGGGKRGV